MKRYVRLSCTTCTRTKDQLIDLTHYTPDKCTITYQCEGRLQPIDYVSNGSPIVGVAPTGVTNWYPRNSTFLSTSTTVAPALRDLSTGQTKQFVVAVERAGGAFPSTATLELDFEAEQQTPQSFLKYTYKRTVPFTIVNGVEDANAKKVLRYDITGTSPDQVEVYVNGVRRAQGTSSGEYRLYDGTVGSPVPPNSVLFNTAVTGTSTQIDVVVTKQATTNTITMVLERAVDDESRVGTGAWEGVNSVKHIVNGSDRVSDLFYLDFTEASQTLPRDVKLRVLAARVITIGSYLAPLDTVRILLSREKQYLTVDKIRSFVIPISNVTADSYMMIKYIDDERRLLCMDSAIQEVFPPIAPQFFDAPSLLSSGTANDDATDIDNTYIIGPDV